MAKTKKEFDEEYGVEDARTAADALRDNAPNWMTDDAYAVGRDALDAYTNRSPFTFDINADALYNQYKDRYLEQGRKAMNDSIGKASAMTGGYGNSYAQTVGNQAYNDYVAGLNDTIPELYALARDAYDKNGEDILNRYNASQTQYANDYNDWMSRYTDAEMKAQTAETNSQNAYDAQNGDYKPNKLSADDMEKIKNTASSIFEKDGQSALTDYLNMKVADGDLTANEAADFLDSLGDPDADILGFLGNNLATEAEKAGISTRDAWADISANAERLYGISSGIGDAFLTDYVKQGLISEAGAKYLREKYRKAQGNPTWDGNGRDASAGESGYEIINGQRWARWK